jgi:hypothetical protein
VKAETPTEAGVSQPADIATRGAGKSVANGLAETSSVVGDCGVGLMKTETQT